MAPSKRRGEKDSTPAPSGRRGGFWTILVVAACSLLAVGWFRLNESKPKGDSYDKAFTRLVRIRDTRKKEVVEYLENIQDLATRVGDDPAMLRFFRLMRDKEYEASENLEYLLDRHYVEKYGDFYDILFLDEEGYVFHSIRKESDYHTNLFEGDLAETKLVQQMKSGAGEHFVEYEYYSPSEEPAAFFASPVYEGSQHLGWFVLQCAINDLNSILTDRSGLGRTGEVYLVNEEKWMLTNSRFMEDSTSLRLRVGTESVREALETGVGTKIAKDYRGVNVLSAFERFDVFGASWVVISEIDEDEVISEHYANYPKYYNKRILAYLAKRPIPQETPMLPDSKRKRVDLNEYAKAVPGERLETYGVATCTAIAVTFPGRFAYLVHISPNDVLYDDTSLPLLGSRRGRSNFLGELLAQIKHYDVYPYEVQNLEFTVIASHRDSFAKVIQTILDSDVGLGHIKLLYNPSADFANIVVDPQENLVAVVWMSSRAGAETVIEDAASAEDLATIVRRLQSEGEG